MRRLLILLILLPLIAFFTASIIAADSPHNNNLQERVESVINRPVKLPDIENQPGPHPPDYEATPSNLGYDGDRSLSPGVTIATTPYDMQSPGRMSRQVEWRGGQMVHFVWLDYYDYTTNGKMSSYQVWDPVGYEFIFGGSTYDGCPMCCHGGDCYHEEIWLDIDTEGKAIVAAYGSEPHADNTGLVVYFDFGPAACFFSPYYSYIPDSVISWPLICPEPPIYRWPSTEYHVFNGDTTTHVVARMYSENDMPGQIRYFKRIGSDTIGYWDYPPVIIDTTATMSETAASSRISGKMALVWAAPPGNYPGDPESLTRDWLDPDLGHSRYTNDIYYMISEDMGTTWGPKVNVTAYDSSQGGWLSEGDLSCLIDSDDKLHIVWNARRATPNGYSLGQWVNFFGGRIFHWDEQTGLIRTVRDADWPINDSTCTGGDLNNMFVVKPMISECDGKFYTLFTQFNDYPNGLYNDCHESNFSDNNWNGTANGELYIAVSDNGGFSWDIARNLTNTISPHCDPDMGFDCESDMWASMSRYGMEVTTGQFPDSAIVDPSGGYTGNHYLDILYVNDKHPGSYMHNAGAWTMNPMKWMRVPCVEPEWGQPIPPYIPDIGFPTWTHPGQQLDTFIRIENTFYTDLTISSVETIELNGPSGWLAVGNSGPIIVPTAAPGYYDLDIYLNHNGIITFGPTVVNGYIVLNYDLGETVADSIAVELIINDNLQSPVYLHIRTNCTRVVFDNTGNIGAQGANHDSNIESHYGYAHMNFFDDCDTTDNNYGSNDYSPLYLYDASPFVLRINSAGDTVLNLSIYDANWGTPDGFRPLDPALIDSTIFPDYQYASTGRFVTQDSTIALIAEYFAPKSPDTCNFIVQKLKVYNSSDESIYNVYVGNIMDWDIPSDTDVRNGSAYDAVGGENSRDLIYCYGAEYGPDAAENNDCVLADQRMGGMAFYNGYKTPMHPWNDSLENPGGPWWTHLNADWVYQTGNFEAGPLYSKIQSTSGWESWESPDPDSAYQDLHMVGVFGEFDLLRNDTLLFINIFASEYDAGLEGLTGTIDKARTWIASRPEIFEWPGPGYCCETMGDANNSGTVNILDITFLIAYLYKGGPPPPCFAQADVNCDCKININDITAMLRILYYYWPWICTCEDWYEICEPDSIPGY